MKNLFLLGFFICLGGAISCASVSRVEIPSNANPTEEVARLESAINTGLENHYDVLAPSEFESGQKWLKEAKSDLAEGQDQREILDDVEKGLGYIEKARRDSGPRREQVAGIVEARQKALNAGARAYAPTKKRLHDLDNQVRDYADDFRDLSPDEFAELQTQYLNLELDAIKNERLGQAHALITGAKKGGARQHTPNALKQAEIDMNSAENLIAANRNNPANYTDAVQKAKESASLLTDILAASRGGEVREDAARELAMQQWEIKRLKGELGEAADSTGRTNERLQEQAKALMAAGSLVNLQKAIENARKEFTEEEAEVFQQGDKLIIRLKAMNFPSGRVELPPEALPTLAKVRNVATELGPESVTVQGHTDSTGQAQMNMQLSQERARSVAEYLATNGVEGDKISTEGYGFKRPIAPNHTPEGRAQNRRVDIVIVPVHEAGP